MKGEINLFIMYSTKYILTLIGIISFQTSFAQEISPKKDSLSIDSIYHDLPELIVKGERPTVKLENGKLAYNMPALLEKFPAGDAFEAIKNIPGINFSENQLNFAGSTITLILNGKSSTMTQSQVIEKLKSIPASQILKAEVMLSAPPQYHVRGAVINVITKDYSGQHLTTGQLQGTFEQSKYAKGSGKVNILHINNKMTLDMSYHYGNGKDYEGITHNVLHPLRDELVAYKDKTDDVTKSFTHNLRAELDYKFSTKHHLELSYTGSYENHKAHKLTEMKYNREMPGFSFIEKDDFSAYTGESVNSSKSNSNVYLHNVSLDYTLPFGLKLSANYTYYKNPEEQYMNGSLGNLFDKDIHALNKQTVKKWLFTADQTHNLAKGWQINYGAKLQFSNNNSFQTTYDNNVIIPEATNSVDINERILNGYVGFGKQFGKNINISGSMTVENYHTPTWNEWHVYPSLSALWSINEHHILNFSCNTNVSYPSYWSTTSHIYYSSLYSEIWGNPQLKPAKNYNTSLAWVINRKYTLVAFANLSNDYISQLPYQTPDRMAVIMKMINFNYRNMMGLQASAQYSIGSWLNGKASATGIYLHDKADDFFDLPFDRNKFMVQLSNSFSVLLSKRANLRWMITPYYQSDAIQGVYDIKGVFQLNTSLHWTSRNGKWNATLSGNNLTNHKYHTISTWGNQHYGMDLRKDWTTAAFTLTYKFGNYKEKKQKKVDLSRMGK